MAGLDSLAEFFYERILPRERRIETLENSFGLSKRVVDDILAELLRKNYAALDVANGEIRVLKNTQPRRAFYTGADEVEIWQDDVTGAILPMRSVDRLTAAPGGELAGTLGAAADRTRQDLLDAPNARIIESLRAVQPSLMNGDRPGFVLDSLGDKERVGPCDVYIPLVSADVDGYTIEIPNAPWLPAWLTRSWSVAFRRIAGASSSDGDALTARAVRAIREREQRIAPSMLDECRLDHQVRRWLQAFNTHATRRSLQTAVDVRDTVSLLQSRLLSADKVSWSPAGTGSHLQDLCQEASSYLLVVTHDLSRERLDMISSVTSAHKSTSAKVVVINSGSPVDAQGVTLHIDSPLIVQNISGRIAPELCVADGLAAVIGSPELLLTPDRAIRIASETAVKYVMSLVDQYIKFREGGWWLKRQLAADPQRLGDRAIPVLSASLSNRLSTLQVESAQFEQSVQYQDSEATGNEVSGDGVSPSAEQAPVSAQGAFEPLLNEARALAMEISNSRETLGHSPVPLPAGDQVGLLVEALENAAANDREKDIDLIVNDVPVGFEDGAFVSMVQKAIAANTRVRLILTVAGIESKSASACVSRLNAFCERIGSPLISVSTTREELPAAMTLNGQVVVIGGDSWFSRTVDSSFGFVLEAPELAEALREAMH